MGLKVTRAYGKGVVIRHEGEELRIHVLPNRHGSGVKLAFEGPRSFDIVRAEVLERKQAREDT